MKLPDTIKIIAFDADDTLWVNLPHYNEVEAQFAEILAHYLPAATISAQLLETERRNLKTFGYGAKGFMLAMIETAIELTNGEISGREIQQIIDLVRKMLARPMEIIDGVRHVLDSLDEDYTLMVLTKGDLLDQETKIARSGLAGFFHYTEIVSEKMPASYQKILDRYGWQPEEFVMIGNSLRSDILPVLAIGAYAIHIPFRTTWELEQVGNEELVDKHFLKLDNIRQLLDHFETPIRHSNS
jgi:putative hydrolase of the HAD superfamily